VPPARSGRFRASTGRHVSPARHRQGPGSIEDPDGFWGERDQASTSSQQKDTGETVNHYPKVHDLERAHGVTWGELAQCEPRLDELLWRARAAGARRRDWNDVLREFVPLRNALTEWVGFLGRHSRHPLVGSVGAYEVAWRLHHALSGLLPAGNEAVAQPAGSSIFRLRRNAGTTFASSSLSQMSGPLAGPQTNPSVSLSFGVDHD
jgi:hypothetical protein